MAFGPGPGGATPQYEWLSDPNYQTKQQLERLGLGGLNSQLFPAKPATPEKPPDYFTTGAPGRLQEFQRFAEPQIGQQFHGALLESIATMMGQRGMQQRQTGDALALQGINPAYAQARIFPEQNQQFAEQVGGMRGAAMAGQAGASMDLRANMLNAMNQIEAYYDSLKLQKVLGEDANAATRSAAKSGKQGAIFGGLLGGLGSLFG